MLEKPEGQSRINNPETQDKQWTQETEKKIDKSNTKPRKLKGKMGNTNPVNMICRSIRCQTNLYHIYFEVLHNTVNQLSLIVSFYLKNEISFTVVLIRSRKFVYLDTCHTSLINENMEHFWNIAWLMAYISFVSCLGIYMDVLNSLYRSNR